MRYLILRLLRDYMIRKFRRKGFTWSKINTVLDALGQEVITHYEVQEKGLLLHFGKYENINRVQLKYGTEKPIKY